MEESATIKMAQMARDLAAQGHDVISLSLGEPDFDTPAHIKEAAKKALDEGYTKYTPVPGLVELRKAIQAKFSRDNGLEYGLNQIVVSNGAKQSIANICLSLLDEGDEVIILAPYWVSYSEIVKLAGGVPVLVSADIEKDYKASAEQIAAAITSRTRVLLFSSPCNPTGSVYLKEELKAIAEVIARHEGIYIISDEIYEYINFTGKHASIGAFEEVKDRTVTVNGFSKGFAMTGWRLGYACAPAPLREAMMKIHQYCMLCAPIMSQMAGIEALKMGASAYEEMRQSYEQRRNLIVSRLNGMGLHCFNPGGAFCVFPEIRSTGLSSKDFAIKLLEKKSVAVVPGSAFSSAGEGFVRCCYATAPELIAKAMDLMEEFVNEVRAAGA